MPSVKEILEEVAVEAGLPGAYDDDFTPGMKSVGRGLPRGILTPCLEGSKYRSPRLLACPHVSREGMPCPKCAHKVFHPGIGVLFRLVCLTGEGGRGLQSTQTCKPFHRDITSSMCLGTNPFMSSARAKEFDSEGHVFPTRTAADLGMNRPASFGRK